MTELLRSAGTTPGMAASKEGITETLARPLSVQFYIWKHRRHLGNGHVTYHLLVPPLSLSQFMAPSMQSPCALSCATRPLPRRSSCPENRSDCSTGDSRRPPLPLDVIPEASLWVPCSHAFPERPVPASRSYWQLCLLVESFSESQGLYGLEMTPTPF